MQLAVMLAQVLESGKVTISTKNTEDLEITAADKKINANVTDKEFIKEVISAVRQGGKKEGALGAVKEGASGLRSIGNLRSMVDDVAEELSDAGRTVTLSYKGAVAVTIGSEAKAKLSRLVTGTKAVEINNLPKLVEMGI